MLFRRGCEKRRWERSGNRSTLTLPFNQKWEARLEDLSLPIVRCKNTLFIYNNQENRHLFCFSRPCAPLFAISRRMRRPTEESRQQVDNASAQQKITVARRRFQTTPFGASQQLPALPPKNGNMSFMSLNIMQQTRKFVLIAKGLFLNPQRFPTSARWDLTSARSE